MARFKINLLSRCILLLFIVGAFPAFAQDTNIIYPIDYIEELLVSDPYQIRIARDVRFKGDKTKTSIFVANDTTFIRIKFKSAVPGGEEFNNEPRYDVAAYRLQKLFLDPENYVVPPSLLRTMPLQNCQKIDENALATFQHCDDVILSIQYWMENLTHEDIYNKNRFATDSLYARHFANFNIFTYLIKHNDSNVGNALISTDPNNPRVFAVDNDVAFAADMSARGTEWRNLKVKRLPKATIDRLREIQLEDLQRELSVVAQFQLVDGKLVPMELNETLNKSRGVRTQDGVVQFGLTEYEINQVYKRLEKLLEQVDSGKFQTF